MASLDQKKTLANLLKKGFVKNETHHKYYEFWYEGKLIAQTYASHGGDTLDSYLIASMKKQCKMEKSFFVEFAKCNKSKDEYIAVLAGAGHITIVEN